VLFSVLATVLYLACLICAWGFISLLTETDVVTEPVGPLIGPIMAGLASVLVLFCTLFTLRNARAVLSWTGALIAGVSVYLLPALVAAVIVALGRVDFAAGLLFFAARVTAPYVPIAALIAAAIVLVAPLVSSGRRG
jgi:hypothetical protein